MNKLRILLADDHEGFRSLLASFLRSQPGVELVAEAVDGDDAIDQSKRIRPDLVLMDVRMPRRDGIEATKAIKAERPEIRVVMMSMESSDSYRRSARAVADGYIEKNSMKHSLLSLLTDEHERSVRLAV